MLTFVELEGFLDDWTDLGLTDTDLHALQAMIMASPSAGKVVKGAGGLRKMRFAPARWRSGKSGAVRVCYVYYPDYAVVLLVVAYSKSERDDLSAADKKFFRRVIGVIDREFSRRFGK